MSENKIRKYERLLTFILLLAVIFGIIGALTGCDAFEVETKTVIDYRYTEAHTEQYDRTDDNGNHYYNYVFVQEKYELLWLETYKDGHQERHWRDCTRFEYQNAKDELGS